ncbi:MAG TPA: hypothetical protein PLT11_07715 [Elusimicrobiota bacterium]|nr:hypothetical protein [Elusimicrobiota bacterium]
MIKSPAKKCLVVRKGEKNALLLEEGNAAKSRFRLPRLEEIAPGSLAAGAAVPVGANLVLLFTVKELSPWELIKDFPPPKYFDYAYLDLLDPEGPDWERLAGEDRDLIFRARTTISQSL